MSIALKYTGGIPEIQPSRYTAAALAFCNSEECSTCSSSSSIGKNSDLSGDDEEVQSHYKRTFDSMDSLEQALPIRRGISTFYEGKSKSFTSLAEASSSSTSMNEIAKTENAYSRKRRNLNALRWNYGGISKKAAAITSSSCDSFTTTDDSSSSNSNSSNLPPLHPL